MDSVTKKVNFLFYIECTILLIGLTAIEGEVL